MKKKPGLCILVIILLAITIGILKPNFYLIGWDNFSSYLNPSNNIFNTIFATWREHRGFGVPSDAEVNDIFRQIFNGLMSFIVGKRLTDQFYIVFMLWGGVLGMWGLGRYISFKLGYSELKQELFGFIAAFFYLFNLNTLAVFYFPMIMYNSRFFMLPTSIYILLKIIDSPQVSMRTYLFYLSILYFGFGAFMVPTIFIVILIIYALMVLIFKNRIKVITTIIFILGLSMYWLLPFANYTIQKSKIVPEAPTFVEINESMINKPKSYYTFERQAKLRPNFFQSTFHNNSTNLTQPFHPLAGADEKGMTKLILWFFPIGYLLGIVYIFLFKRDRILIWLALTVFVFLMLSMKDYSPFGLLYGFISDHFPFANTIFRFGDTKFHVMIAFSGSIIASVFFIELLSSTFSIFTSRIFKYAFGLICCGLIITHFIVYRSYFTGNFIGFFMYNKIPSAYFDIAETINRDPDPIRVIQLPFDSHGYWKPYAWGYFGSAFFHFMINKPLFDRSFEPASRENTAIHQQIINVLNLTASVPNDNQLNDRALDLYHILRSASIKYVIDDQTISTNIDSRDIAYWGTINAIDSDRLLSYLQNNGYLNLIKRYEIPPGDYSQDYAKLYPYNNKRPKSAYPPKSIQLFEVLNTNPRIQLLSEIDKVSSTHEFLSSTITRSFNYHYIQSEQYDNQSLIFLFAYDNPKISSHNNQISLDLPAKLNAGDYTIESKNSLTSNISRLFDVYLEKNNQSLIVDLAEKDFPIISNSSNLNESFITRIELQPKDNDFQFLDIAGEILSIGNINSNSRHFLGSIITHGNPIPISLLYAQDVFDVGGSLVQLEPDPQCFHDALENPTSHITGDNRILHIWGQNVSNCLTTTISIPEDKVNQEETPYLAKLDFEATAVNENLIQKKNIDSGKPLLNQYVTELNSPVILYVCIKLNDSVVCSNKDLLFQLSKEKNKFSIPLTGNLSKVNKFFITFAVRNNQRQKYDVNITNIFLKTFISDTKPESLSLVILPYYHAQIRLEEPTDLSLTLPEAISEYNQFIDLKHDGVLTGHDPSCDQPGKIQATKKNANGVLSYAVGCKNFINKNIPFSSNNFYLWQTTYKHLSGAIPALILMDKLNTYFYHKLNPNDVGVNDYFSIPLQKPETLLTNKKALISTINQTPLYNLGGYIEPQFDLQDTRNKEFIIDHFSENEGLAEIDKITLTELPNYWPNSVIFPADYQPLQFNGQSHILSYARILPSLWQVKTVTTKLGESLLLFNEQYDKQWIILGAKTSLHARCDGYVNCYKIILPNGSSAFYIFYIPEVLSFVGFSITMLIIIGGFLYIKKKSLVN